MCPSYFSRCAIENRRAATVELSVIDIGESSGECNMPSPFPGMNPWLEQVDVWHDFHQRFITRIGDALFSHCQAPFFERFPRLFCAPRNIIFQNIFEKRFRALLARASPATQTGLRGLQCRRSSARALRKGLTRHFGLFHKPTRRKSLSNPQRNGKVGVLLGR